MQNMAPKKVAYELKPKGQTKWEILKQGEQDQRS